MRRGRSTGRFSSYYDLGTSQCSEFTEQWSNLFQGSVIWSGINITARLNVGLKTCIRFYWEINPVRLTTSSQDPDTELSTHFIMRSTFWVIREDLDYQKQMRESSRVWSPRAEGGFWQVSSSFWKERRREKKVRILSLSLFQQSLQWWQTQICLRTSPLWRDHFHEVFSKCGGRHRATLAPKWSFHHRQFDHT